MGEIFEKGRAGAAGAHARRRDDLCQTLQPHAAAPGGVRTTGVRGKAALFLSHFWRGRVDTYTSHGNCSDRAFFGQKDAAQCALMRQLVRDLNFNLELVVVPTARASDGETRRSEKESKVTQAHVVVVVVLLLLPLLQESLAESASFVWFSSVFFRAKMNARVRSGLALSSRNAYLSLAERAAAPAARAPRR